MITPVTNTPLLQSPQATDTASAKPISPLITNVIGQMTSDPSLFPYKQTVHWEGRRYTFSLSIPISKPFSKLSTDEKRALRASLENYGQNFVDDFKERAKKQEDCQIKPGDNFSILFSESGYTAFLPNKDKTFDPEKQTISEAEKEGYFKYKLTAKDEDAQKLAETVSEKAIRSHLSPPKSTALPAKESAKKPETAVKEPLLEIAPRGLNNLGNTCFLNTAFQQLATNPLIMTDLLKHPEYFVGGENSVLFKAIDSYHSKADDPLSLSALRDQLILGELIAKPTLFKDKTDDPRYKELVSLYENQDRSPLHLKNLQKEFQNHKDVLPILYQKPDDVSPFLDGIAQLLKVDEKSSLNSIPISRFKESNSTTWQMSDRTSERHMLAQHPILIFPKDTGVNMQEILTRSEETKDVNRTVLNDDGTTVIKKVDLDKVDGFTTPPEVLIIRAERGHREDDPSLVQETAILVEHTLKLPEFVTGKKSNYRLMSFSRHLGSSIIDGHYVTYFRGKDNQFFLASDDTIKQVQENEFLNEARMGFTFVYNLEPKSSGPTPISATMTAAPSLKRVKDDNDQEGGLLAKASRYARSWFTRMPNVFL